MGIELELAMLLAVQTLGTSFFAAFEVETPGWRKALKWTIVVGGTLGLYAVVGHWALLFIAFWGVVGGTVHVLYCRKHGIHPLRETPRRKYYELRGWSWQE